MIAFLAGALLISVAQPPMQAVELPAFAAGEARITYVPGPERHCAVEFFGERLVELARGACPEERRVGMADLPRGTLRSIVLFRLIPAGQQAVPTPVVPGERIGLLAAELAVDGEGTLTACRDADRVGVPESVTPLCTSAQAGERIFQAIERDGVVRMEMVMFRQSPTAN